MLIEALAVIIGLVVTRTVARTDSRLAARLAALASLGASVVHFAVVPNHWQEWMPAGLFFVSIAVFQLGWARVVLIRSTWPVLASGVVVNVAGIALWAVSRTAGSPFGPHAGQPEVVQAADLCALVLQIYVVMGAGWVWYRGLRGEPVRGFASAVILMGASAIVALASTVGVASGVRHGHGAAEGADHHATSAEHAEEGHDDAHRSEPVHPVGARLGEPAAPARPPLVEPVPSAEPLEDAHGDHDHST